MYLQKEIERLIDVAIAEDIGSGDITSQVLVPEGSIISGWFVLKQAGVVAGLPFLEILFQKLDPDIQVSTYLEEGSYQKAGAIIAKVSGPSCGILSGERIALNLIQHASGVATITAAYVRKLKGLKCEILDTRKTLPGLRYLEKYAVKIGGGSNHRFSLDDRFIIKTNHLYFLIGRYTFPIQEAVKRVKNHHPGIPIEVEITNIDQLAEALQTEAEAIMLSRMSPSAIKRCVDRIRATDKKVYIESLGTVTLDTVRAYAETGVDGISIGSVTHSVPALDIVMRLK
ncbi:MAG: Nicotinate-nucleotide pyrophosphorylase [carboxylating] [Chlamydiae bacterium]|nr:Nicotinate-nucleotide pyrophosphorylase [carboxylating] [Chlamydiota bacterium]